MARTTGPLMSLSASGSVAKTLTYAHWKGRPYVRQLVTPSNPRSQGQYYTRAMMAFLSRAWGRMGTLNPTQQAEWDTLAKQGNFSAFNAMVKTNMMRWTQTAAPSVHPTAPGLGTPDVITTLTATGGVRQIALDITAFTAHDGWGYAIAVDPTNSATPAITQTRIIMPGLGYDSSAPTTGLISQLDPGTFSTAVYQFTAQGDLEAMTNLIQGITVT